jgi:hypothetical protein
MPNITTQQLESILEDKLKNALAPLSKSIEETKTSVAFISNKYDELLAKMTKYDQERKDLVIENTSLRAELLDSSKQIKMLRDSINSLEQYTRRDCAEIRGIPYVEGENTNNIVMKLGEKIGVNLNKDDISTSHRLPIKRSRGEIGMANNLKTPPGIIVKFVKRDVRESFYRARKLLKDMTTRDLGYSGENRIFVNESLTQKNKDLFNECLKIKKDKGFRFLWTYAGKIFMRRNENSQVIHVTDASILQKIDK